MAGGPHCPRAPRLQSPCCPSASHREGRRVTLLGTGLSGPHHRVAVLVLSMRTTSSEQHSDKAGHRAVCCCLCQRMAGPILSLQAGKVSWYWQWGASCLQMQAAVRGAVTAQPCICRTGALHRERPCPLLCTSGFFSSACQQRLKQALRQAAAIRSPPTKQPALTSHDQSTLLNSMLAALLGARRGQSDQQDLLHKNSYSATSPVASPAGLLRP